MVGFGRQGIKHSGIIRCFSKDFPCAFCCKVIGTVIGTGFIVHQEIVITPITVWEPTEKVPPNTLKTFVVVLPKFTIPDKKNLFVELTEESGGRHLQLKLRNRKATEVVPLPTFNE